MKPYRYSFRLVFAIASRFILDSSEAKNPANDDLVVAPNVSAPLVIGAVDGHKKFRMIGSRTQSIGKFFHDDE